MMRISVLLLSTTIVLLVFLTGCRTSIVDEALQQAGRAIDQGDFEQASLILHLARSQSDDTEFEALHEQSVQLVEVNLHIHNENVEGMLLAWAKMMLIESDSTLITDEALELVREVMEDKME